MSQQPSGSPEELAQQRALNAEMLAVAERILKCAQEHPSADAPHILLAIVFFRKATKTFQSIQVLDGMDNVEDAICLLRVLAETTINLGYIAKNDPVDTSLRYLDWMMLDAFKRCEAQDTPESVEQRGSMVPPDLRAQVDRIKTGLGKEEAKKRTKHPFGKNIEQRATEAGFGRIYQSCYRITSRTSHATDMVELAMVGGWVQEDSKDWLPTLRVKHVLSVSRFCLGGLMKMLNRSLECGEDEAIQAIEESDIFDVTF